MNLVRVSVSGALMKFIAKRFFANFNKKISFEESLVEDTMKAVHLVVFKSYSYLKIMKLSNTYPKFQFRLA